MEIKQLKNRLKRKRQNRGGYGTPESYEVKEEKRKINKAIIEVIKEQMDILKKLED